METNILTTTLTNETSPELLRNEIDSRIVKIRPSSTPLDQISRGGSMRAEYYSVDTKEGSAALDETVRSLSLEPGKPFTLKVNNGAIFSETETVLIPDITVNAGNYNGQALVCYVTAVSSDSITLIPVNIAGPCSAESREQVLDTALQLKETGISVFRAGVWKPRTHPGCFEGRGSRALGWLREVKALTGLPVATEIASSSQLAEALDGGIDILWLGARTTTNPFAVQEIADAAKSWAEANGRDVASLRFLVKNPANQDLELWIGAIQRLYNAGIRHITAIHRGFSVYGNTSYRNPPQ